MTATATPPSLLYPTARIRGRLVTRSEETTLRWGVFDATAADELGREHVGWFVGNHPGTAVAVGQLGRLDANPGGGVWVVVPHSRQLACDLFALWPHAEHAGSPPTSANSAWRSRKVWVAIPEDLKHLRAAARQVEPGIAGVIVLDPPGVMHQSRGGTDSWGHTWANDRPQRVVNFRADLAADGWQPPLLLLTTKPALAVDTAVAARAYSLDGFRFIAGDSFGCWEEPIESE